MWKKNVFIQSGTKKKRRQGSRFTILRRIRGCSSDEVGLKYLEKRTLSNIFFDSSQLCPRSNQGQPQPNPSQSHTPLLLLKSACSECESGSRKTTFFSRRSGRRCEFLGTLEPKEANVLTDAGLGHRRGRLKLWKEQRGRLNV